MNKLFLLAPLALAASLASCSNDDQPSIDNANVPVNFSASINGSTASRAYDQIWESGDIIGISGTSGSKTYTNVAYKTNNGNGNFTIVTDGTAIYYQSTEEVTFTAYYPWNDLTSDQTSITADTYNQQSQKTFDYLWATGTGSKASPNVNFAFNHKMAKIVLTLKKGADVSFDEVKAAALSLAGFHNNGTFDVITGLAGTTGNASPEWTFANNTAQDQHNAPLTANDQANTVSYTLILFPQEFSSTLPLKAATSALTFSTALNFTVANGNAGDQSAKNELVAGRQYNISVTLHKTALTVEGCTITDWTETDGGNFDAQ